MKAASINIILYLQACCVTSFSSSSGKAAQRSTTSKLVSTTSTDSDVLTSSTSTSFDDASSSSSSNDDASSSSNWATHAILFSSLSDGIIPNQGSRSFLRHALTNKLLYEQTAKKEDNIISSAEFSPCNGPDIQTIDSLETIDQLYERGQQFTVDDFECSQDTLNLWSEESLQHIKSDSTNDIDIRVLYIPTASYALNPQSRNTPGKQRQRARADGKKRRTQLLNLLDDILNKSSNSINDDDDDDDDDSEKQFNLLSITLDLDDGSLKQPIGSDESSLFPADDKEAISSWPHLIYVEGGNTFWLQHCIEKGNYSTSLKNACIGLSGAVYMGKSAGAIVAGSNISTATWKGWDDPAVVPGKESYDDWLDCDGFGFSGMNSYFPHMSSEWKDLVKEKIKDEDLHADRITYLREEDACCVIGSKKSSFVLSGTATDDDHLK